MALDFSGPPVLTLPELPAYRLRRIVRPSLAFSHKEPAPIERTLETTVETLEAARSKPGAAKRANRAPTRLLQYLLKVLPEDRPAAVEKALAARCCPETPERHARHGCQGPHRSWGGRKLAHLFGAKLAWRGCRSWRKGFVRVPRLPSLAASTGSSWNLGRVLGH